MKSFALGAVALLISLIATSCSSLETCIEGNGDITSTDVEVTYFESINLETSGNVFISQGDENKVRIESNKEVLQNIKAKVDNETLVIKCDQALCPDKLNIYVTVKDLSSIQLTGNGNIYNFTPIQTDELYIKTIGAGNINLTDVRAENIGIMSSGNGNINLDGNAKSCIVEVNGSGNLNAVDLSTEYLNVTMNGSGEAKARVESKLITKLNGSGDFKYIGEPTEIKVLRNGTGNVKKMKTVS